MNFAKFRSSLKDLLSAWWFTPAVGALSFAIPLLLPRSGVAEKIEGILYPPAQWAGAVAFRLADVPGFRGDRDVDLILVAHSGDGNSRVTFLREGSAPDEVTVGAPQASLIIEPPKSRTSGIPLFDIDLPSDTLVAASVSVRQGATPSRYTLITSKWTKTLNGPGDLVILPRNELRKRRLTYWLSILALGLAAVFMPRYAHLIHPEAED